MPSETELRYKELVIDRKRFLLSLRENRNGKFIRIIETNVSRTTPGRSGMLIIPVEGARDLVSAILFLL